MPNMKGSPGNFVGPVKFGTGGSVHQMTGSLYVSGSVFARNFNVDTVTTTVTQIHQSGSTNFGDTSGDTHIFTGSMHVSNIPSGSLAGAGSYIGLNADNQLILTASSGGGSGVTINNATVNEIVTVASNTSELDAEANLTFDGETLTSNAFSAFSAYGNATTINTAVTMPADYNSILYGPITIGTSGEFTIGTDSIVKIKDISDA